MLFEAYFPKIYIEGGMAQMKLIYKQRKRYAFLFAASICLSVWLGGIFMLEAVFALGAISAICLILLVMQSHLLNDALLIWNYDPSYFSMWFVLLFHTFGRWLYLNFSLRFIIWEV